ncbi:MAG: excinuclease ABC subunit UvrA [Alphaproteobacteria bacterium]
MYSQFISIRGAREHNLKNISVDLPRNQLIVITGVSGSGKSSLAFDTIYAEGQRRYVESLSAYARQFLELTQKPEVDSIEGLSPAISIEQKTTSKNPRSTVGTITEIYDYLRLLFARIGVPYSPTTGKPIQSQTISEMVDRLMGLDEGTKLALMAPLVRGRKGEYKKEINDLKKKGFQRLKINGQFYEIDNIPALDKNIKHTLSVVVDRILIRPGIEKRLADAFETILPLGEGLAIAENVDTQEEILFSEKFCCPESGFTLEEIEPRLFSFNSPFGACPACDGLGIRLIFDENLVIPNPQLSLREGAIEPWFGPFEEFYYRVLESVAKHYNVSTLIPFSQIPKPIQHIFLYGSGTEKISIQQDYGKTYHTQKAFEGVLPNLERRWKSTESERTREELSKYQSSVPCDACHSYRLKPEALCVKINHLHIGEITDFSIEESVAWFETLSSHLTEKQKAIAVRILKEIKDRLSFLKSVGLDYLTLSRTSGTLSGGESQRIRLASQIGSGLTGVLYVLDEPSIGLHQRDNDRLLETLQHLRNLGNTVIVVEHDEDAIKMADYVLDMGPYAGKHGGEIVAQGTPDEIAQNPASLTGAYLKGTKNIPIPEVRRPGIKNKFIRLEGASSNNLKNVSVDFPLGKLTCVTGVSGGGKSTLVNETLYKALNRILNKTREKGGEYKALKGVEHIDKVINIDQSPIGRTPRSNPATYTGIFTPIREWFAKLPEAKSSGYTVGRFSFNVKGGRCEACQGDGVLKIEMHFLPDVFVTCDHCKGKRYNRETLDIKYKDKSIADVLDMSVDDGIKFFEAVPSIRDKLETLQRVGLGYMEIGQRATTLSGGEAQRIKLSKELSKRATGRTLYILDEPTTGLHFEDIRKLLEVLHELVDQGNSMIVIEHNLDVIKTADWIIDLGPEGGDKGGEIITQGTPEDIIKVQKSYTGRFLKPYLEK